MYWLPPSYAPSGADTALVIRELKAMVSFLFAHEAFLYLPRIIFDDFCFLYLINLTPLVLHGYCVSAREREFYARLFHLLVCLQLTFRLCHG